MRRTDEIEQRCIEEQFAKYMIADFIISCVLAGAISFIVFRALFTSLPLPSM